MKQVCRLTRYGNTLYFGRPPQQQSETSTDAVECFAAGWWLAAAVGA